MAQIREWNLSETTSINISLIRVFFGDWFCRRLLQSLTKPVAIWTEGCSKRPICLIIGIDLVSKHLLHLTLISFRLWRNKNLVSGGSIKSMKRTIAPFFIIWKKSSSLTVWFWSKSTCIGSLAHNYFFPTMLRTIPFNSMGSKRLVHFFRSNKTNSSTIEKLKKQKWELKTSFKYWNTLRILLISMLSA